MTNEASDKKPSVLIADDERLNLDILNDILQPEYTVHITKNGITALEMAIHHAPDLILLDVVMPDINGFDVLSALKISPITKNIPVIFITGLNNEESEEKGLDLGAADYIQKPFNSKIVKLKVRNQIRNVNQFRAIEKYAHNLDKLHNDLEEAVNAAQTANKAKSDFLAKMSHEIRTPLNAILGISEIQLQNESYTIEAQEAFSRIYNSGCLLLGIINDILDMSKIEAGKLELSPSLYDIAGMINDSIYLNLFKYDNKPIEFIFNIDENIPVKLFGDDLRIKQILNNLLSNAFKYTYEGEVILTIGIENKNKIDDTVTLIINVTDTGQGMTCDQLNKLFDDYSRFNISANRLTEGTGLGMSITRNLIRMMKGDIKAESNVGKGSSFTVRVPQGDIGYPPIGRETADKLKLFRQNIKSVTKKEIIVRYPKPFARALIVDDMEMNLYVGKGMLSPYEIQIDTATSGMEAIELIETLYRNGGKYDIIFMDHMMPHMDGIQTTHKIREMGNKAAKIPIIALTANAVSGVKEMFLSNGLDGFISKPINVHELDKILNEWIPSEKSIITEPIKQNNLNNYIINDLFINNVKKISSINTEIGLIHACDDINVYKKTLDIFHDKLLDECSKMSSFLENDNINGFQISVHAVKSMLAIIGAEKLSEAAKILEASAANLDSIFCKSEYPIFHQKLKELHKNIGALFSDVNENTRKIYKGKALIVDDMDMILFVVKNKLKNYGLESDTALNGKEAIEKNEANKYDIIFMDQMMPEMDGSEAVNIIRKREKEKLIKKVPIILLTADDSEEIKESFLSKGFNGLLPKPIGDKEIEKILDEFLIKN